MKKVISITIQIIVGLFLFGVALPFLISEDSYELPILGGVLFVGYILFYINQFIKKYKNEKK